jgi:hypothetical protein
LDRSNFKSRGNHDCPSVGNPTINLKKRKLQVKRIHAIIHTKPLKNYLVKIGLWQYDMRVHKIDSALGLIVIVVLSYLLPHLNGIRA